MSDIPVVHDSFEIKGSPDNKAYLIGARCTICGYVSFPKKVVCVRCRRDDTMERVRLGPYGTLDTFTVMQVAPPGFIAPYMIGYVRLREGPIVFSLLTGCETKDDALKIGEEMELVIEKINEDGKGNNIIGWKFKPIRRE